MIHSVDMMITFCLKSRISLFQKIGFFLVSDKILPKKGFSRVFGRDGDKPAYDSYEGLFPMVFNLSESIVKGDPDEDPNAAQYSEKMSPSILEFYFKDSFLRSIGKPWQRKPFNLQGEQIKEIFHSQGTFA
jgi:hypothetical protein